MKWLIRLLQVVLVLLLILVGVGFLLPGSTEIEREVVIDTQQPLIFELVSDHQKIQQWSPWAKLDPKAEWVFAEQSSGVGASMSWTSEHPELGSGSATYVDYQAPSSVAMQLHMDGRGEGLTSFFLQPEGEAVKVVWRYEAVHDNLLARYLGLMLDNTLEQQFAQGLDDLKTLAESLPTIVTREISYEHNGVNLSGYFAYPAYPAQGEPVPGVVVVHEWWGHNDYARKRADMLAQLGYAAFALDMYGDNKLASHPKEAMAFMNEVVNTAGLAQERFNAGLTMLRGQSQVDGDKIAAIGYCFGGAVVLSAARSGADIDGVVSFHGGLSGLAPIAGTGVESQILVLNGEADPFVSEEHKTAFKAEMDAAGVDYSFVDYPGVQHSFTRPEATKVGEQYGLPLKYDAEADADSWRRMQDFFQAIFSESL